MVESTNTQSANDIKWMKVAVQTAQKGLESDEVPVGAVFVHKEETLLAQSHNLTTLTKNATTHCEINCIREISKQEDGAKLLQECTVYVTVEPCIMCAYALNLAKVKRVVFGTHNDKFGGNGSILSLDKFVGEENKEEKKVAYEVTKGVLAE